jgi:hypothetical protein
MGDRRTNIELRPFAVKVSGHGADTVAEMSSKGPLYGKVFAVSLQTHRLFYTGCNLAGLRYQLARRPEQRRSEDDSGPPPPRNVLLVMLSAFV